MSHSPELAKWLDTTFNTIFFQPDDTASSTALDAKMSKDVVIRINEKHIAYEAYKQAVADTRRKFNVSLEKNATLLQAKADPEGKAGSVAQHSAFTLQDKDTGNVVRQEVVIIATVVWKDGERSLTELTEVNA